MDAEHRHLIRERAQHRCEYCLMPQKWVRATFHIEHIVAKQHGGSDGIDNRALACDRSNLYKGPNLASVDPESGSITVLFNPRQHDWCEHFELRDAEVFGRTALGRATVQLLNMNASSRRRAREVLLKSGEWESK